MTKCLCKNMLHWNMSHDDTRILLNSHAEEEINTWHCGRHYLSTFLSQSLSVSPLRYDPLGPVCHHVLLASPWQSPGWLCSPVVCLSPPRCEGPAPPPVPLWTAPPHWPRPPDWTAGGCCLEGRGTENQVENIWLYFLFKKHILSFYCVKYLINTQNKIKNQCARYHYYQKS